MAGWRMAVILERRAARRYSRVITRVKKNRDRGTLMAQRLKIIFAGTPAFAAAALTAIHAEGFEVPLVLTQPDRPAGRGMKYMPSPVNHSGLGPEWALISRHRYAQAASVRNTRSQRLSAC